MSEIGRIKMRSPGGNRTWFTVHLNPRGHVDLCAGRSNEGEILIQLRKDTAQSLGELLIKAAATP